MCLIASPGQATISHLQLQPGLPPTPFSLTMDDTVFRATFAGIAQPIEVPATRARVLSILPIADRDVMIVAFGIDPAPQATQDLVALVGWDGSRLRILGLETLSWHRADGADLALRLFATPDRKQLLLSYMAAAPRPATRPFRLGWTDYLAWQDGAALIDAAPRPPLAASWQWQLSAIRARIAAVLATPVSAVSPELLAATGILGPLGF